MSITAREVEEHWSQVACDAHRYWFLAHVFFIAVASALVTLFSADLAIQRGLLFFFVYGFYAVPTYIFWRKWLRSAAETRVPEQRLALALFISFSGLHRFVLFLLAIVILPSIFEFDESIFLTGQMTFMVFRIALIGCALVLVTTIPFAPRFTKRVILRYRERARGQAIGGRTFAVIGIVVLEQVLRGSMAHLILFLPFFIVAIYLALFYSVLVFYQLGMLAWAGISGAERT